MMTSETVLAFKVPPQPHLTRAVRLSVAEFALAYGIGENDLANFLLALGEALANAVEHARAREPLAVEVRVSDDRVVGTVQDDGVGFASERTIAVPELPGADAERGRGLPLMRHCSDIFAVHSRPGKGTSVVFGRFRTRTISAEVA